MKWRASWLGAALVGGLVLGCSGDLTDLGSVDDENGSDGGDGTGGQSQSGGTDGEPGSSADGSPDDGVTVTTTSGHSSAVCGTGGAEGETVTVTTVSSVSGASSGTGGESFGASAVSGTGGESFGASAVSGAGGFPSQDTSTGTVTTTGFFGTGGAESGESTTTVGTTGFATGGSGGATVNEDCSEEACPGLCFGTSCGGDWLCHPTVACPDDEVAWCGCDGETFYASSGCPMRPFAYVGECE